MFMGFTQLLVAILLTGVSGFVDALGFLTFARIYTANMSGNSVAFGIALSSHEWHDALFHFWPVFVYVIGLIFGRSLIEVGIRTRLRRIAAIAFSIEILLLSPVAFATAPDARVTGWSYTAIALLAAAMGIQNAALTRFSTLTLHTGFVTGTLVTFAEYFVACASVLWDELRAGHVFFRAVRLALRHKSFLLSTALAITWVAYAMGAVLGTWLVLLQHTHALIYPIAALLFLAVADSFKPLSAADEQKQSQLENGNA